MSDWERFLGAEQRNAHFDWINRGRSGPGRIVVEGADLSGARFGGERLSGARLVGCRLDQMAIDRTQLHECEILDCAAHGGALYGCEIFDGRMERCRFVDCNLSLSNFNNQPVIDCDFTESGFERSTFVRCTVERVLFHRALLRDTYLAESSFVDCDLQGADLTLGTQTQLAIIRKTRFLRCDFRDADFEARVLDDVVFEACRFLGMKGKVKIIGPLEIVGADVSAAGDGSQPADQVTIQRMWR